MWRVQVIKVQWRACCAAASNVPAEQASCEPNENACADGTGRPSRADDPAAELPVPCHEPVTVSGFRVQVADDPAAELPVACMETDGKAGRTTQSVYMALPPSCMPACDQMWK